MLLHTNHNKLMKMLHQQKPWCWKILQRQLEEKTGDRLVSDNKNGIKGRGRAKD